MEERSVSTALADVMTCTSDLTDRLQEFAPSYPGVVAIGSIVEGRPYAVVVLALSDQPDESGFKSPHYPPETLDEARMLARLIARMPVDVRHAFVMEFDEQTRSTRRVPSDES